MTNLRIALIAEGDAETKDCWSGSAMGFVRAMRRKGVAATTLDAQLAGPLRLVSAALSLRPSKRDWRSSYNFGGPSYAAKSAIANRLLRSHEGEFDLVVQVGGTFKLDRRSLGNALHAVYCDANVRFAERGGRFALVNRLSQRVRDQIAARERSLYHAADRVWTMSNALARSFIEDFGLDADRVVTLYAGANAEPSGERSETEVPIILFVGKEHERKGSKTLLEAFRQVRATIPAAELHFVGADLGVQQDGVVSHGFIPTGTAEGRSRINDLYARASVFCLPSNYEAFGIVFVEAMLAGLPCVGSRAWAMPEIIEAGATGLLAEPGNSSSLAQALLRILTDPDTARKMGQAGRERALELFTWDRVADRALADVEALRHRRPAASAAPDTPIQRPEA
jgi:alpha-maltose-1-phosphate synthase